MFADVAGPVHLAERIDAEQWREVMAERLDAEPAVGS